MNMPSEFKPQHQLTLAYRNRFVEELTQELSTNCEEFDIWRTLGDNKQNITLNLTSDEFTELLSAVMTGADLIYPEKSHQIVWHLLAAVSCVKGFSPSGGGGGNETADQGATLADIDRFFDLLEELDMKYSINGKIYEVVLPLVECGCGDGTGAGTGADNLPPGGTPGGDYGDFSTLCDFVTTVVPYINGRVDNMVNSLQNSTFAADFLAGAFDELPIINDLKNSLRDSLQEIETELIDPDWVRRSRIEAARIFNDPPGQLSRSDLRSWVRKLPLLFEGAPMQSAYELWSLVANIAALNEQIENAAGTGNSTICDDIFGAIGRVPLESGNALEFDFTTSDFGWTIAGAPLDVAEWTNGIGWTAGTETWSDANSPGNYHGAIARGDFGSMVDISALQVRGIVNTHGNRNLIGVALYDDTYSFDGFANNPPRVLFTGSAPAVLGEEHEHTWNGLITARYIEVWAYTGVDGALTNTYDSLISYLRVIFP